MSMARQFYATSEWPAIFFSAQYQTINVVNVTPAHPLAAENPAPHSFTTRLHNIYAFILPALLALLGVKSAGKNTTSPFQVHPVTTGASVFGVMGYYLAFMASVRFPSYATLSSIAMSVCGSLSLASLVTLLLPDSCWYIKYIFYVLFVLLELLPLLKVYLRAPLLTVRRSPHTNPVTALPLTHMDLREQSTTISTAAVTTAEISGRFPPPSATANHLRVLGYCPSPPTRLRYENTLLQDGGAQALTVGSQLSAMPASENPPLQDGGAQALTVGDQLSAMPASENPRPQDGGAQALIAGRQLSALPASENPPPLAGGAQALTVGARLSAMPSSENPPLQDGGAQALTVGRRKHQAPSTVGCSSSV